MNRARSTAEDQLQRILYILPAAARGGLPLDEIARALDVEPAIVLKDLEDATARAFYHPAGSVDSFSILTDGRTVEVHASADFARPARLNQGEAMALGLGLRTLAAEADADRRREILELAARLEAALTAPEHLTVRQDAAPYMSADAVAIVAEDDVEYEALGVVFDDDGYRGVFADAVELRRLCTIRYLKPGDAAPAQRSIAPYRLIHAYGRWYVHALDVEREGLRTFRMDRIIDARLEEDVAPSPPADLDERLQRAGPYSATDEVSVRVRYSPKVSRWIAERTAARLEQDGSAIVEHRVADPGWIVRHVLQYAGEAVVEEPEQARRWLVTAATRLAR